MRLNWEPRLERSFVAAAGLVIGAGTAIYSGVEQKKQADQIDKNNPYPTATVPQAALDNQQYAKQAANEGLPSQILADSQKEIQRNQSLAIRQAQNKRAGSGLIGPIVQGTNDAEARLSARNQQAQLNNQRQLYGVNNTLARYQQSAQDWNLKNRYNEQYNYGQQLLGAGNANIVHGIDAAGNIIARKASSLYGTRTGTNSETSDPNYFSNISSNSYNSPNTTSVDTSNYVPPSVNF